MLKSFATIVGFLLISLNVKAHNCSSSPYWTNGYKEEINEVLCLSISNAARAHKAIMVDTTREYLGLDRVWLEIYDWDGDDKADWIRLSNYLDDNFLVPDQPYEFGAEVISFYHGPEELKKMLRQYGKHLSGLIDMEIPETEMGTCHYDGRYNGLEFKPNSDPFFGELFSLADALLSHNVHQSGRFAPLFAHEITQLMNKKVLDFPAEWRKFEHRAVPSR